MSYDTCICMHSCSLTYRHMFHSPACVLHRICGFVVCILNRCLHVPAHTMYMCIYCTIKCPVISIPLFNPVGRSVQLIGGKQQTIRHNSDILRLAVEIGFDWVILESASTIRLSVIPDCKLLREGELMRKCMCGCVVIAFGGDTQLCIPALFHVYTQIEIHTLFESLVYSCVPRVVTSVLLYTKGGSLPLGWSVLAR